MELNTIKDVFDRVIKKQKLSSSKIQEVIDQIRHAIENALDKMQSVNSPSRGFRRLFGCPYCFTQIQAHRAPHAKSLHRKILTINGRQDAKADCNTL